MRDPRSKNDLPTASNIKDYLVAYSEWVHKAVQTVAQKDLEAAAQVIEQAANQGKRIYVGGNGGSSAIGDHLCCDWMKGTYVEGKPPIRVQSLTSNSALFTALGNDFSYKETLSAQIEMYAERGDVLVLISSSGNSPNIVEAAEVAKKMGVTVIGLCGFEGGKLKTLADVPLYIPVKNYGVVEDAHQTLMHVLAQYTFLLRTQPA